MPARDRTARSPRRSDGPRRAGPAPAAARTSARRRRRMRRRRTASTRGRSLRRRAARRRRTGPPSARTSNRPRRSGARGRVPARGARCDGARPARPGPAANSPFNRRESVSHCCACIAMRGSSRSAHSSFSSKARSNMSGYRSGCHGSVNHVPSVKRSSRSSCSRARGRERGFDHRVGALVARERERPAARRQHANAGRFVVDMGQRLAHERLGLVAGEAQPPAGFLERERGAHQEVTALARPRHRGGLLQVTERAARVAGRQLALGDAERAARRVRRARTRVGATRSSSSVASSNASERVATSAARPATSTAISASAIGTAAA